MSKKLVDVFFVGCGTPTQSIGWLHCLQTMKFIPNASVIGAFSPYSLAQKKSDFMAFKSTTNFPWYDNLDKVDTFSKPTMAVVSTRADDNPALMRKLCEKGVTHVYLEKPGAATTEGLEEIQSMAKASGMQVMMGYNKNGAGYVAEALAEHARLKSNGVNATVSFEHVNEFTPDTLEDCFTRNSEGLLRNMACHEIALAVSLFDINPRNLKDVVIDRSLSDMQTLAGYTDFSKIGFTISNDKEDSVKVIAERCGVQASRAYVGDKTFTVDTPENLKRFEALKAEYPGCISYFYPQWDDYLELKTRLVNHMADGKPGLPSGVVTLDHAVDVMKMCDSLTASFKQQLSVKSML